MTKGGYDERGHVDGERKRGGGADEDEKGQYSFSVSRKPDERGTKRRNWVRDTSYTIVQLQRMGEMAWAS